MNNYYDILGVSFNASQEQIKKKFRELSLKFHPDKVESSLAEEMMKKINEAYSVLSDPKKRQQYDSNSKNFTTDKTKKSNSAKQVWKKQLKDMGKGLAKLLKQYLENQKNNQTGSNYSQKRESDYCGDSDFSYYTFSRKPKKRRRKTPKKNIFEDSWEDSMRRDQEFLDNMFGFDSKNYDEK